MLRFCLTLLLLPLCGCVFFVDDAGTSGSQSSLDNPIGTYPSAETAVVVALNGDGLAAAAWNVDRDIYVRHWSHASGWAPVERITSRPNPVEHVRVAIGRNTTMVAWEEPGFEAGVHTMWRINSVWETEAAPAGHAAGSSDPVIATRSSGATGPELIGYRKRISIGSIPIYFKPFVRIGNSSVDWSEPKYLDANTDDYDDRVPTAFGVDLALGGSSIAAVWMQNEITPSFDRPALYARRHAGGRWGEVTRIDFDDEFIGSARIACDRWDNAHVVYVRNDLLRTRFYEDAAGRWDAPVDLETEYDFAAEPSLSTNSNGDAVTGWVANTFPGRIFVSRFNRVERWDEPRAIDLPAGASSPRLGRWIRTGINSGLDIRVVWTSGNQVWTAAFDAVGGTWTPAELIGTTGTSTQPADFRMDDEGRAIAVWWNDDGFQSKTWPEVEPPPPGSGELTAEFTWSPEFPAAGSSVAFDASASTGPIVRWDFDFELENEDPDNETQSDYAGSYYVYANPGVYYVTLTVWDADGNSAEKVKAIEIR